jgi:hypothetical protein
MKNKKYNTVETVLKYNRKIIDTEKGLHVDVNEHVLSRQSIHVYFRFVTWHVTRQVKYIYASFQR